MDLSAVLAAKDKYMSDKYADSSDEENEVTVNNRSFKAAKSLVQKKKKNNNLSLGPPNLCTEKPYLKIVAPSEKEPLVLSCGVQVPALINQYLRDYQRNGVKFLWEHFEENTGCILADDMGLGKTIQVISFFASLLRKTGFRKNDLSVKSEHEKHHVFLVIAPTSVLYNWQDEINVWGFFRQAKFHGRNKEEVISMVKQGKLEVVLTTHETMRLNIEILTRFCWSAIVIDEAHRIKEPDALLTIAAKELHAECRIALTGTPMQNNLMELWCLLDWANPGCLGTQEEFDMKFVKPICIGQRFNASKRELASGRKKQQEFAILRNRWLLRRSKNMIQDQLPHKFEKIVFCTLSKLQVEMYEEILKLPKVLMLLGIDNLCSCESGLPASKCCLKYFNRRKEMFPHIQLLLKVSNHSALLLPFHRQTDEQTKLAKSVCQHLFRKHPALEEMFKAPNFSSMSNPELCGKMLVLRKLLNALKKKGDKVLIFSHSTKLLNILEAYVMSRGIVYRRLDGQTAAELRNSIVKEFNSDSSIFVCLLSTTAGSLGLNFTSANYVVIFDPMWNPSHDIQAQDRAYRIGQMRDVFVYRLISVGTIEENMYMRQIYKQQLANTVVDTSTERRYFNGVAGDPRYYGELFGLHNMFKFSKDHTSSFARDTFNRVKTVENDVIVANYHAIQDPKVLSHGRDSLNDSGMADDDYESQASQCLLDETDGTILTEEKFDPGTLHPPLACKTNVGEKCATDDKITKVKRKKQSSDDDLLGVLTKVKRKKQSSDDDLLSNCGVSFVHSTKTIVGSSVKEGLLTKRAIKDVFWDGVHSQELANDANGCEVSDESQDISCDLNGATNDTTSSHLFVASSPRYFERVGSDMFIVGSTPPAVQAKHFEEMAQMCGKTIQELAAHVLSCPAHVWRKELCNFYLSREPNIRKVSSFNQIFHNLDHLPVLKGNLTAVSKKKRRSKVLRNKKRVSVRFSYADNSDSFDDDGSDIKTTELCSLQRVRHEASNEFEDVDSVSTTKTSTSSTACVPLCHDNSSTRETLSDTSSRKNNCTGSYVESENKRNVENEIKYNIQSQDELNEDGKLMSSPSVIEELMSLQPATSNVKNYEHMFLPNEHYSNRKYMAIGRQSEQEKLVYRPTVEINKPLKEFCSSRVTKEGNKIQECALSDEGSVLDELLGRHVSGICSVKLSSSDDADASILDELLA